MWRQGERGRLALCLLISLACLFPGLFQAQPVGQQDYPLETRTALREVILLTEEEAGQFRLTAEQLKAAVQTKSIAKSVKSIDGPHIIFQKPDLIDGLVRTTTPLSLSVAFQPNLAPVDKASLKVRARKGIFGKNLTDIVLPYVVPHGEGGWSFVIENVRIPQGNFRIEITIADQEGGETVQEFLFQVTKRL
ncbi:MAG: hypothetical protein OXP66_06295 [Candidatus Tectomicrobia bacterium]|nr:hypothetical protein [Candidatus Tectomicrobia bacterium]